MKKAFQIIIEELPAIIGSSNSLQEIDNLELSYAVVYTSCCPVRKDNSQLHSFS